jgi:hypothetical protein
MWEGGGIFTLKPVRVVEPSAQPQDLVTDLLLSVGECEVHLSNPSGLRPISFSARPRGLEMVHRLDQARGSHALNILLDVVMHREISAYSIA